MKYLPLRAAIRAHRGANGSRSSSMGRELDVLQEKTGIARGLWMVLFLSAALLALMWSHGVEFLCNTICLCLGMRYTAILVRDTLPTAEYKTMLQFWVIFSTFSMLEIYARSKSCPTIGGVKGPCGIHVFCMAQT